jgi:hypothetical protein
LWGLINDDRIVGHRSDLPGIKMVSDRKNQLPVFMLGDSGYDRIEDVGPAIH